VGRAHLDLIDHRVNLTVGEGVGFDGVGFGIRLRLKEEILAALERFHVGCERLIECHDRV
jgi:hypothetical protein